MKLIIDIPEKQYEYLAKISDAGEEPLGYFERVIMCGTPLPKGHGRLIDADVLVDGMEDDYEFCEAINATPTIIEAESENKK